MLDIEVRLDLSAAGTSDDLGRTVDYEEICAAAQSLVEAESFHLIEAIAERVAAGLLERFPVTEARVQVRKPAALRHRGVPYAAVEVRRRRDAL